jgi:nucleotide-binding universal stress UspA family protein
MYKTLLVPVDARPRSARSIEMAARIAHAFEAHVVGLFVRPAPYVPFGAYSEGRTQLLEELQEKMARELAEQAQAQFDAGIKAARVRGAEWRIDQGDAAEVVSVHARYADLVVINQTDPYAHDASHFADAVLMSLSRPALIVPYAGNFDRFARRVLVCWNASREAARAVTDALPFLKRADKVTVMSVDGRTSAEGHGESPGSDISLFLARHGVKAEVLQAVSADVDVGNVILSRAADESADLIVMGAYGHARVLEIVLGGATRTILRSMTVPVLMSH